MELVTVLMLIGIMGAVAAPRFFGVKTFQERGFADTTLSALRFAQKVAVSTGCDTAVDFDSTGYRVMQRASCTSGAFTRQLPRPGGGNFQEQAPAALNIVASDVYFDVSGRPHDLATGNLLNSSLNVSVGGITLVVEPETGYAHGA